MFCGINGDTGTCLLLNCMMKKTCLNYNFDKAFLNPQMLQFTFFFNLYVLINHNA